MIILKRTIVEIESTLKLYPYSKLHCDELKNEIQRGGYSQNKKNELIASQYIVDTVEKWFKILLPDEREIIKLRILGNRTYDFIAIQLGYANHSSVIRKYHSILKKIYINDKEKIVYG